MSAVSRKYWAWIIVAAVVIGLSYTAVWLTEQVVQKHRAGRSQLKRSR